MPRRPPAYAPRGLIWKALTLGDAKFGEPYAEWAYVTPRHPSGMREGALRDASSEHQPETALHWFRLNYEPFVNDGSWFGFGSGNSGFGQGAWAPTVWASGEILRDEFGDIVSSAILTGLATVLQEETEFWTLKRDQPQTLLSLTSDEPLSDRVAKAERALDHLQKALDQVSERGVIGDNQGPILDEQTCTNVKEAIEQAQDGVKNDRNGTETASEALNVLQGVMTELGKGLLRTFGSQMGKAAWSPAEQIATHFFHSLQEAVVALAHWLTAFM